MNGLDGVIRQLEAQKVAIERALEALREVGGIGPATTASPSSPSDRRSAAQKRRWATKRSIQVHPPAEPTRKGGMTPQGRKRLSEAMKRRWAAKRSEAQAKKGPGRPKKAA